MAAAVRCEVFKDRASMIITYRVTAFVRGTSLSTDEEDTRLFHDEALGSRIARWDRSDHPSLL